MKTGVLSRGQVLIVEDDLNYAKALAKVLMAAGYIVDLAESSRSAPSLVGLKNYDLVLSDIQMPELNGIQLYHSIRNSKISTPVVLMTGFTAQVDQEEAMTIGAAGFLAKPFSAKALLTLLDNLLPQEIEGESVNGSAEDFCEISIDDFVSGKQLSLDVYVRLSEGKYVKVANAGEGLSVDRLATYRKRSVGFLYVSREDYAKYVSLQLKLARAVSMGDLEQPKKVQFLKHANEVILQQIFMNGVDERAFSHAKSLTEANLTVLSKIDELFSLIEALNKHADHVFAHSLGVSVYASMLAKALGWNSPSTLHKVSMGGLLHDVGLKDVPREILDKPSRLYSREEQKLFEKHPISGLEMLKGVPDVPTEVLLMVAHHHENRNGTGYPAGLRESSIYPLARLIAIVDEFCDLTIRSPGAMPRSPLEAIQFMNTFKKPFFDSKILETFSRLFAPQDEKLQSKRKV